MTSDNSGTGESAADGSAADGSAAPSPGISAAAATAAAATGGIGGGAGGGAAVRAGRTNRWGRVLDEEQEVRLAGSYARLDWMARTWLPTWLDLDPGCGQVAAQLRALAPILDRVSSAPLPELVEQAEHTALEGRFALPAGLGRAGDRMGEWITLDDALWRSRAQVSGLDLGLAENDGGIFYRGAGASPRLPLVEISHGIHAAASSAAYTAAARAGAVGGAVVGAVLDQDALLSAVGPTTAHLARLCAAAWGQQLAG